MSPGYVRIATGQEEHGLVGSWGQRQATVTVDRLSRRADPLHIPPVLQRYRLPSSGGPCICCGWTGLVVTRMGAVAAAETPVVCDAGGPNEASPRTALASRPAPLFLDFDVWQAAGRCGSMFFIELGVGHCERAIVNVSSGWTKRELDHCAPLRGTS